VKKAIFVLAAVVAIALAAGTVYAEDLTGRFAVGVVGGAVVPKDDDTDNTGYIGGNIAYGINEYVAVGAEFGYAGWDDEEGGVDYGDIHSFPLLADVYLRYPMEIAQKACIPYVIGGIGEADLIIFLQIT